ncbi:M16 family metallopeptidase [Nakamurella leprariae]|uniref:Insulinase family protein n=1 Tax=Nakamurella leprariae TaxID=2803911 RepID=A0A938Y4F8_9ACTN|nr:pitrilysin family protein [Nakamurella leprariae]MBM9465886.1 insulinase family protein [Nakamurella leprariae]
MSVLSNGLRVATETVPGARSVSVGVWVGVGSVDETPNLAGASHYLEHVLFKGTRSRTGAQISEAIDAVGGELNAFTAHEYTCYYARVLAAEAALAVDIVCDVVLDAVVAAQDVDLERSVILEEIAMRDDDPEDTLGDAFAAAVFPGHPVGDPVIGSVASISGMSRGQVAGWYRRRYQPERMVVAVAGGVEHGDVVRWVRAAFAGRGDLADSGVARFPALARTGPARTRRRTGTAGAPAGGLSVVHRDIEQAHLCLGVRALPRTHPDRAALEVLATAVGGGMSSRLFRRVREERGLAYSCYAGTSSYADVGSFSVYAGCSPDNLAEVSTVIGAELADVVAGGLTDDEIRRAKGQLTGSIILGLEDPESRMSRIGRTLLVRPDYRTLDTQLADIDAVTAQQVAAVAGTLLGGPLAATVVGPYRDARRLPAGLTRLVG